jgi:hypothetical protein
MLFILVLKKDQYNQNVYRNLLFLMH